MVSFVPVYRQLSTEADIFAESYDRGLELRVGYYFCDPKPGLYDNNLRQQAQDNIKRFQEEMDRIEGNLPFAEGFVAFILYFFAHPSKSLKAQTQAKNVNSRK
jgi:hypothetical protein